MVSAAASQQEGSGFDSTRGLGSFCVEFACSPRVCVGSLRVLRLPPTIQRHACGDRLIGDSKVALGVNVCVNGCLSLCCPVMNWRLVQGVPRLSPVRYWDRLQSPRDPDRE